MVTGNVSRSKYKWNQSDILEILLFHEKGIRNSRNKQHIRIQKSSGISSFISMFLQIQIKCNGNSKIVSPSPRSEQKQKQKQKQNKTENKQQRRNAEKMEKNGLKASVSMYKSYLSTPNVD